MRIVYFLFSLSLFCSACETYPIPRDDEGREDFEAFHRRFENDSLFQIQRIDFDAIAVHRKMTGRDNTSTEYTEENWLFQKQPDSKENTVYIDIISPEFAIERIQHLNAFFIERHYNLNTVTKNWYLSYYSDIQTKIHAPSTPGGEEYRKYKDSLAKEGKEVETVPQILPE